MEESSNIIDFDLDFDEEELFAISNMHFEDDDTAEVLVPEELFWIKRIVVMVQMVMNFFLIKFQKFPFNLLMMNLLIT